MDKKEVIEHMDKALKYMSSLSVNGDAVDVMFSAKQELRAAYAALTKETEDEHGG